MPYINKLKELKEERGMTNGELARLSNVPLATITRIFNGHTPNPTFETVSALALALGTSLDVIAGAENKDEKIASPIVQAFDAYAELLKEKDKQIRDLKEERTVARKDRRNLIIALCVILGIVVLFFAVDVFNGNFGYFRY